MNKLFPYIFFHFSTIFVSAFNIFYIVRHIAEPTPTEIVKKEKIQQIR